MYNRQQHREHSPYLKPERLPEVLAAIQTMSILDRYRSKPERWADLIAGDEQKGAYWKAVFDDHPEFFRRSSAHPGEYALIWRRAGNRRYHRKHGRVLTKEEYDALSNRERDKYMSRPPVADAQIKALMDTAISLHKNAVDYSRDWRWWVTPLIAVLSVVGSFVGAIVGAKLKSG